MQISLIIPTYNAEQYLSVLLPTLKQQSISFELILVDSSSLDKTENIAKQYTDKIIVIPQKKFDHGGTRTEIAKQANGEVIVFMTQDALPFDNKSIENLVKKFEDKNTSICYGQQVAYEHSGPFGTFLRKFNYPDHSNERVYEDKKSYGLRAAFVSNAFCAYRKSSLEEVGYFENRLILSEDMYAAAKILRAGGKVCYVADAKVYHSHDYTVVQEFKRYFDIGVFHSLKPELQKEFGSAAGEGKRFVKEELKYLIEIKSIHLIPLSFIRNGAKLLAYKLGKNHKSIPKKFCPHLSMHKSWW
ncbi:MAG: glycosyl transferase [Sulfurovum sp.]|nr:MAG: glycosyl transferase [Sulfurovum sp.]